MQILPEFPVTAPVNPFKSHLRPFTITGRVLGLNNSRKIIVDWCIVLIMGILYTSSTLIAIVRIHDVLSDHMSTIEKIVETIQLLCGLFLMIICYLNSFRVYSTLESVLEDLNQMDIHLSSTRFVSNYKFKGIVVLLQFSIHCLFILCIVLIHIFCEHEIMQFHALYYCIRFLPIFAIGIIVLLFVNITDEVKLRLCALNDMFQKDVADSESGSVPDRHLFLCSTVYELAFSVCFKLNKTFGNCNLFLIGYCFISITAKLFFIFITLNNLQVATIDDACE